MTPAQELRQAVDVLRNPLQQPGLCAVVNLDFTGPLIELLETSLAYLAVGEPPSAVHIVRALAVARAINTQE